MPDDPEDAKSIFLRAMEFPSATDRDAFIATACTGRPDLQARVETLLKSADDPDSLLDKPIAEIDLNHVAGEARQNESLDFLEPSDDPKTLGRLAGYAILEVIGRGGMGIVLRGTDSKLNRVVAIKVLAPEFAGNPQARKRFLREAQAAAAVSHDHVVTIHAIDDDEKLPFIVMECIVGQSLQQKIDRVGALGLKEILRIGMQTAAGLAEAHAQGLVHRDIKPANILLENGVERVKLTDFGLARMVDDASVTQSGVIAGTPMYMSPEQARGDTIDHRSDLFSLGCVMYAMSVGHAPFRASTTMGVLKRVCEDVPRPVRELNPEIPNWLVTIIDKLLAKSPEARYQTAAEVSELLRQCLAHVQQPHLVPLPAQFGKQSVPIAKPPKEQTTVPPEVLSQLVNPSRLLMAAGILNWIGLLLFIPFLAYLAASSQAQLDGWLVGPVIAILAIGSSVIIFGATRMSQGDSYRWAMASTIGAMIVGPGYLIGWPAGIWSLAILTRPEVRDAFRQRKASATQNSAEGSTSSLAKRLSLAAFVLLGLALLFTFFHFGPNSRVSPGTRVDEDRAEAPIPTLMNAQYEPSSQANSETTSKPGNPTESASTESPEHWGPASPKGMKLGVVLTPTSDLAINDVVNVKLLLKNAGTEMVHFAMPRLEVLEKLGLYLVVTDDAGQEVKLSWGKAHKSRGELTVSGAMATRLAPGQTQELDVARIQLGCGTSSDVTACLDVKDGQTCRVKFLLSSYSYIRDQGEPLETTPVEIHIRKFSEPRSIEP